MFLPRDDEAAVTTDRASSGGRMAATQVTMDAPAAPAGAAEAVINLPICQHTLSQVHVDEPD